MSEMTEDLKNRIRNFIVGWDVISPDPPRPFTLEDYKLWMDDAIELLEETLGNDIYGNWQEELKQDALKTLQSWKKNELLH